MQMLLMLLLMLVIELLEVMIIKQVHTVLFLKTPLTYLQKKEMCQQQELY